MPENSGIFLSCISWSGDVCDMGEGGMGVFVGGGFTNEKSKGSSSDWCWLDNANNDSKDGDGGKDEL
jgi:hypothetical protein